MIITLRPQPRPAPGERQRVVYEETPGPVEPPSFADELDSLKFDTLPAGSDDEETYEQAEARINLRYAALERNGLRLVRAEIPSFICSGPPGLGKSYTLDQAIATTGRMRHDGITSIEDARHWYDHISGGCTAPGLYHALWNMRQGGVLLIDDCDQIFFDPEARNLLKIATDSSKKRMVSWRKKAAWLGQNRIESTFDFQGHVAFLTNIDFERVIERNTMDADHFKALIDRSRYLCLTVRTQRDFMIRIRQVALTQGMLRREHGLSDDKALQLIEYVNANRHRFYNLSLRLVSQIADDMRTDPAHWLADTEATKMKTTAGPRLLGA